MQRTRQENVDRSLLNRFSDTNPHSITTVRWSQYLWDCASQIASLIFSSTLLSSPLHRSPALPAHLFLLVEMNLLSDLQTLVSRNDGQGMHTYMHLRRLVKAKIVCTLTASHDTVG